jgi:hypothetical protein
VRLSVGRDRPRSTSASLRLGSMAPTTASVTRSCRSKMSATSPSKRSAQTWRPESASQSCAVMRTLAPAFLTLPSST